MKMDQLRIRLTTLLIKIKHRYKRVKLKKITNLDHLIERRWWLTLDLGTLIHQKFKGKKYYQKCRKECITLRATPLEEREIDMADIGKS